jgi:predicted alpha/beta superfamily hydrolase
MFMRTPSLIPATKFLRRLRFGYTADPGEPSSWICLDAQRAGRTLRVDGSRRRSPGALATLLWALLVPLVAVQARAEEKASPLVIGDTFTIDSKILGETRRINVYPPPGYAESRDARVPVLYMPDGGMAEDFLHVAGLVQISVTNGTMRPFLLVGIENTQRRRDLTGPTQMERDKKIAPRVGGSEAFRRFIRDELMPRVKARYRTTPEAAIVGESLAGLFVVETFLLEPELFDTYIALDPSLWWNDQELIHGAAGRLRSRPNLEKTLYLASSDEKEIVETTQRFAEVLSKSAPPKIHWHYERMPEETHMTIYHPAALKAFRAVFGPHKGEGHPK